MIKGWEPQSVQIHPAENTIDIQYQVEQHLDHMSMISHTCDITAQKLLYFPHGFLVKLGKLAHLQDHEMRKQN